MKMTQPLNLGLLDYQNLLKVKRIDGKTCLFDEVRRKWLVLQPEELVRQLIFQYLVVEKAYSRNRISIEKGLKVNTLQKRFDLLVYDSEMQPFMLIECKAPKVKIQQEVFKQIATYNTSLRVPYLLVTNGINTYCCEINYTDEDFSFLEAIPDYEV